LRLPAELERVDDWLDDETFLASLRQHFDPLIGRPSLPMETYLRVMFLKVNTGWGTRPCPGRCPTGSRGGCFAASTST
jgi:hypothetical protein